MAQVITAEHADGRSYVRRAMKKLAEALAMTAKASRTEGLAALWYVYRAENWH